MRQVLQTPALICLAGVLAPVCATGQAPSGNESTVPKGTRIAFDSRGKSLAEVLEALSKAGPLPVVDQRSKRDNPIIPLSIKGKTYWESVDAIVATIGGGVYPFAGDRVALVDGPRSPVPPVHVESYRIHLQRVTCYRDFDSGLGRSRIMLGVVWEPQASPLLLGLGRFEIRYAGAQKLAGRGTGRAPVVGRRSTSLTLDFDRLPREATKIDRLNGKLRALGPSRMIEVVFDGGEISKAKSGLVRRPAKNTVVAVKGVKPLSKRLWQITIELRYPSPGPPLESFETHLWVARNGLWLESKKGARKKVVAKPGTEFPLELRPDYALIEYTVGDDKNGPDLGSLADWRVHYRTPERVVQYDIPFEFRDIPLP